MSRRKFYRPVSGQALIAARIVFVLGLIVLTYISLRPAVALGSIENADKIMHALAYFTLALIFGVAFPKVRLLGVFILPSLYGGLMEIMQGSLTTGRSGSIYDMIANMSGAFAAVALWWFFVRFFWNPGR